MINVTLIANSRLTADTKYRLVDVIGQSTTVASSSLVRIGNFSSTDLFTDSNAFEINFSMDTCLQASHVVITSGLTNNQTSIVGEITGVQYINNNNSKISYVIDPYTSAVQTSLSRGGFFSDATGLCARTNLSYSDTNSLANQLPEPVTTSTSYQFLSDATNSVNQVIQGLTGCDPLAVSGGGATVGGYAYLVLLSPDLANRLSQEGQITPWATNPTLTDSGVLPMQNRISTLSATVHCGGLLSGFPIVFTTETPLNIWLSTLARGNIGSQVNLDDLSNSPEIDGEVGSYYVGDDGYVDWRVYEDPVNVETFISIKHYTIDDILDIKLIPQNFCTPQLTIPNASGTFTSFNLSNLGLSSLSNDMSKLTQSPFAGLEIRATNGSTFSLDSSTYLDTFEPWSSTSSSLTQGFFLRFVGGDNPQLQIAFTPRPVVPSNLGFPNQWITLLDYPSVSFSSTNKAIRSLEKVNARRSAQASSNIKYRGNSTGLSGVVHALRGGTVSQGSNLVTRAIAWVGQNEDRGITNGGTNIFGDGGVDNQYLDSRDQANANTAAINAPSVFLSSDTNQLLGSHPIAVYFVGATLGEISSVANFFNRRGQACLDVINPITNSGSVFSGRASISSFNGLTFYQFTDLTVTGTMPVNWRNAIINLFGAGVYLIN
jgi:hypothetical protein